MKSAAVKVRSGDKLRLSKIDPDDTGGLSKEEAWTRFVDLREEVSLLQEKLFAEHERSLLILFSSDGHRRKRWRGEGSLLRLEPGRS